jgi:hypothetical protein
MSLFNNNDYISLIAKAGACSFTCNYSYEDPLREVTRYKFEGTNVTAGQKNKRRHEPYVPGEPASRRYTLAPIGPVFSKSTSSPVQTKHLDGPPVARILLKFK